MYGFASLQHKGEMEIKFHNIKPIFFSSRQFSFLFFVFEFLKFFTSAKGKQYQETELYQGCMNWHVRAVYNRAVMVPPIAAIAFIRLLCGVRSADVALCKRCMQCKMEPSERDRDNETCKRYGGARLWGISSVFLLRYHSIISLVGRKYESAFFFFF